MRFFGSIVGGNSVETASFFVNRSLTSRMLLLGLPLLAAVLALIFFVTGGSLANLVNRAIARNTQLQTQAMSLALEQILVETRNQLLILAAGSMDRQEMARRLKFRSRADGLRYREVAFMGLTPENRYLLLNYGGEIIAVPPHVALDAPAGPFHNISPGQRPGHVNVSQPLEVVYSMVPIDKSLQSLAFYVLRFSTPIYDATGNFQGILILSLDLNALRDTMSLYSSPEAPISAGAGTRVRSLFFDQDGWMLFQSENLDNDSGEKALRSDAVRAGFRGDFGRPGFSMAFRPGPEHLNYWTMVAEVQAGRSGRLPLSEVGTAWNNGQMRVESVSYAPVTFMPNPEGPRVVVGGLAMLDSSFTSTHAGIQLLSIYTLCFLGGLLLLGLSLWWLARNMGRSLNLLSGELRSRNEDDSAEPLNLPPLPLELEAIKQNVDTLLDRLRRARADQLSQAAAQTALWQREAVEDLPDPADLPTRGLVGASLPMQVLYDQIQKASQVLADVLIVGETGTGKELVSESIHRLSARADGPFITINCGALDEALLMDTLFGHVKGAFTEAKQARKGAFLAAEGGTLMLDEVGNATPKVQQALLRALSTRCIRPLGSDHDVPFDTRIIAATNAELRGDGQDGSFRDDLYYRLAVITIHTPSLRQRKEDIPALMVHFMNEAVKTREPGMPRTIPRISRGALEKLMRHHWPGNVRELKNTLTRALTFCDGDLILAENIQLDPGGQSVKYTPDGNASQESRTSEETKGGEPDAHRDPPARSTPASEQGTGEAPSVPNPDQLNHRQRELLPRLAALGSVSRQEYQNLAGKGISMRTAQYDLQQMVRLGLMRKEGRGPAQRYVIVQPGGQTPADKGRPR
ncbi:MAG: sigma 54-interacting transcriptional regulator [Desulfovibrio sp.]|uniref:sigma 54-interacting transcriptional regulator n=1 Tax=Desulfovibrio sp. TaxID=885 RepID=UPI0025870F5F|nr:sigma 54-interacting transcriptional regulator [Desulfovibrio sp.]MCD7984268.1 sigma 54-interacting transcriptional regulator [Desulfovibrio sp.]